MQPTHAAAARGPDSSGSLGRFERVRVFESTEVV
jgi:hypothetical protein